MALQKRSEGSDNACGFGVFFKDSKTFVIFKDLDVNPSLDACDGNLEFDPGEEIETLVLDRRIIFTGSERIGSYTKPIIFLSPYLEVKKVVGVDNIKIMVESDTARIKEIIVDSAGVVSTR